jgi:serine/threonine protein kinase
MRAWHDSLIRLTATCRERHYAIHSIHHAAQRRSDAPTAAGAERVQRPPIRSVCLFVRPKPSRYVALSGLCRLCGRVGRSAGRMRVCLSVGRSKPGRDGADERSMRPNRKAKQPFPARTRQCPGTRLLAPSVRRVSTLEYRLSTRRVPRMQQRRRYMSPERISGLSYMYKSDVWSLGIVSAPLVLVRHPPAARAHARTYIRMHTRIHAHARAH